MGFGGSYKDYISSINQKLTIMHFVLTRPADRCSVSFKINTVYGIFRGIVELSTEKCRKNAEIHCVQGACLVQNRLLLMTICCRGVL